MTSSDLRGRSVFSLWIAACVQISSGFGCYDMSFKRPPQPAQPDSGTDDAGQQEVPSACSMCLESAACAAERASCDATEGCATILACVADRGCYGAIVGDVITCAIPCATQEGVFEVNDPVVMSGLGLALCFVAECGALCEEPVE